jgi:hypothetical protein
LPLKSAEFLPKVRSSDIAVHGVVKASLNSQTGMRSKRRSKRKRKMMMMRRRRRGVAL